MQIAYNKTPRKDKIKYIVVHDTGNKGKGADANAHFNYYNTANRNSSADIFADSKGYLVINDYKTNYTWHCGDGKGRNGITNGNSVGVEICINQDGDYNEAVKWAAVAVRKLMCELNIPIERVMRHFDASGKLCPATMSENNWSGWSKFKELIQNNEVILQTAAKIEDRTIDYLKSYSYGTDLINKLTQAILE